MSPDLQHVIFQSWCRPSLVISLVRESNVFSLTVIEFCPFHCRAFEQRAVCHRPCDVLIHFTLSHRVCCHPRAPGMPFQIVISYCYCPPKEQWDVLFYWETAPPVSSVGCGLSCLSPDSSSLLLGSNISTSSPSLSFYILLLFFINTQQTRSNEQWPPEIHTIFSIISVSCLVL